MRQIKFNEGAFGTLHGRRERRCGAVPAFGRGVETMSDEFRPRDRHHALPKLAALLLPLLAMVGCSSGISGHAPGLAGPQSQDPGTFTYPLAYIKRPPPTTDIDAPGFWS